MEKWHFQNFVKVYIRKVQSRNFILFVQIMHLLLSLTTAIESKQLRVYKHDIAYESMGKNVELFVVLACTNLIDE